MRRILPVLNLEPFYDEPDKYRWQELMNDWLTVGKACRLLELVPFAPYSDPPALEFQLNERWPEPPFAPEEFYTRPVVLPSSPLRDRKFGDTEWRDDEREKIGTKAFRELSDELSPKMVEGFALESLEVSKQLQKTFFRPLKNFKLHKDEALRRMSSVTAALCIYGELDRAANGVRPLPQLPLGEFRIPNYQSYLDPQSVVTYFAGVCGRDDLVREFAPFAQQHDRVPVNDPVETTRWELFLLPRERLHDVEYSAPGRPKGDLAPNCMRSLLRIIDIWAINRSPLFPPERCAFEIDRLVREIFSLPGYAPWRASAYPYWRP